MKKVFYFLFCLFGLSSCSSENTVLDSLRVYDVANSACKTSLSTVDMHSDFYAVDYGKPATFSVELGKDGTVQCLLEDVKANCSVRKIHVDVVSRDSQIDLIVYHKTLDALADCLCDFDVKFKMSKLSPGKYNLNVYYATPNMKYSESTTAYKGQIELLRNKKVSVTFKPELVVPEI